MKLINKSKHIQNLLYTKLCTVQSAIKNSASIKLQNDPIRQVPLLFYSTYKKTEAHEGLLKITQLVIRETGFKHRQCDSKSCPFYHWFYCGFF